MGSGGGHGGGSGSMWILVLITGLLFIFNGAKGASVNMGCILVRYSIVSDESNAYMLVGEGIIHI